MWFKKTKVPINAGEKELDAVQTWTVMWYKRCGDFKYPDIEPQYEVFMSVDDANEFKTALVNAFNLLRYTSGISVTITKNK